MMSPGTAGPGLRSRLCEEVAVRHNTSFSSYPPADAHFSRSSDKSWLYLGLSVTESKSSSLKASRVMLSSSGSDEIVEHRIFSIFLSSM